MLVIIKLKIVVLYLEKGDYAQWKKEHWLYNISKMPLYFNSSMKISSKDSHLPLLQGSPSIFTHRLPNIPYGIATDDWDGLKNISNVMIQKLQLPYIVYLFHWGIRHMNNYSCTHILCEDNYFNMKNNYVLHWAKPLNHYFLNHFFHFSKSLWEMKSYAYLRRHGWLCLCGNSLELP